MGIADSPLRERVIFIEGMPRSGTTALVSMLSVHDELAGVVSESRLFSRGVDALYDNHGRHGRYDAFLSGYCDDDEITDLVRDLCDGVLTAMRSRVKPDAGWVVEKSPAPLEDLARTLEYKLRTYPDAWYVHLLRDREETVASLAKAPWNPLDEDASRAWWDRSLTAVRDQLSDHPRFVELDYGELRADPVGFVAGLLERIGLDVDAGQRAAIEAVSRERISTFAPEEIKGGGSKGRAVAVGARLRAGARRLATRPRDPQPSSAAGPRPVGRALIDAIRDGDAVAVEKLTTDDIVVELRSGAGDLRAAGAEGRERLLELGRTMLTRELTWETWTVVEQPPTVVWLLGAIRSDGRRLDASMGMLEREGRIGRLGIISAGPPSGRLADPYETSPTGSG
jgi:hypothetical protein